jgi:hypothetical protein
MWCCQLCGWCLCPWLRRWAPQWSESWCLNRCGVPCLATMGRSQMCQWGISPWWKWCCMFSFSWGNMTCQCMYFGVSYFQTRQSWLWDVMSQHGPKTHRLWWIHINSTLRTIPLHVTGTYFDRFSHDFQMISDPKSFQNDPKNRIPDATWLTGSLGLGTAQRQAASAAERIEGGAMCPRRKFTTFPCWTSYNIVKSSIFVHFFPRSS